MGLDMYLRGDKFITTFDDTKRDKDGKALRVKRPVVDGFDVEKHILDLGTWRKFAPLHVYIVNEFADGVDECHCVTTNYQKMMIVMDAFLAMMSGGMN